MLLLFLVSCMPMGTKKLNWSDGEQKPEEQLSIVTCSPGVTIKSYDGNKEKNYHPGEGILFEDCRISVEPGKHTFVAQFSSAVDDGGRSYTTRSGNVPVKLNAEAGKQYQLVYKRKEGNMIFSFIEVP